MTLLVKQPGVGTWQQHVEQKGEGHADEHTRLPILVHVCAVQKELDKIRRVTPSHQGENSENSLVH